jgi:4-oxalocrotonate tautomerase
VRREIGFRAIEEIKPEDWAEKVYRPDILNSPEKLYKEPG